MKKIISIFFGLLFALCIEVGLFLLIAHWWGMIVAIAVVAIEGMMGLWIFYEMKHAYDETEK